MQKRLSYTPIPAEGCSLYTHIFQSAFCTFVSVGIVDIIVHCAPVYVCLCVCSLVRCSISAGHDLSQLYCTLPYASNDPKLGSSLALETNV